MFIVLLTVATPVSGKDETARRLMADPFVAGGVATPRILEVAPLRADARLAFLLAA